MTRPLCFVLMPFGRKPDGGGGTVDFDLVYRQVIRPAVEAVGLEPIRADEEQGGGLIHKAMFERLILCPFAVADFGSVRDTCKNGSLGRRQSRADTFGDLSDDAAAGLAADRRTGGRPRCLPRALAAFMPAVTRSLISEDSNSDTFRPPIPIAIRPPIWL